MSGLRRLLQVGLGACVIAVALSFLGAPAQASLCDVPEEVGTWVNSDPDTRGITQVMFRVECRYTSKTFTFEGQTLRTLEVEPHYFVRVYGSCSPADCDWGEVEGKVSNGPNYDGWHFHYDQGFATREVYLRTYPEYPGWLLVRVYTDWSYRNPYDYTLIDWFRRP